LHPHQVTQWKQQLQREARVVFEAGASSGVAAAESHEVELYEQIGRLKMELEWLKKKLGGLVP
jgi:putative transposase